MDDERAQEELTYEDELEPVHAVPQDGIKRRTPADTGPNHEPEKKAAPAHKGLGPRSAPDDESAHDGSEP